MDAISSAHIWNDRLLLNGPVSSVRQLSGPALMPDYFILTNELIMTHLAQGSNFNFQMFPSKAFDSDFEQVVGISFWTWIYSILPIFSMHMGSITTIGYFGFLY